MPGCVVCTKISSWSCSRSPPARISSRPTRSTGTLGIRRAPSSVNSEARRARSRIIAVLESMTPAERVAFILHDVFRYPFADVAEVTGRTPAACRQLASSARRRLRAAQAPASPTARQARIVRDFNQAWEANDIGALIALL